MIRKRRTQIIAAMVALLMLGGVMVIDSGYDPDEAPAAPPVPESSSDERAREAPQRRLDYGKGYESRHGHRAADRTHSTNHPPEESSP